jgi:hypothetical protein
LALFVRDCDKTTAPFAPAALGVNHALAGAIATLQALLPFFRARGPAMRGPAPASAPTLVQTTLVRLEIQLEAAVLHLRAPRPLVARALWGLLAQLDLLVHV